MGQTYLHKITHLSGAYCFFKILCWSKQLAQTMHGDESNQVAKHPRCIPCSWSQSCIIFSVLRRPHSVHFGCISLTFGFTKMPLVKGLLIRLLLQTEGFILLYNSPLTCFTSKMKLKSCKERLWIVCFNCECICCAWVI